MARHKYNGVRDSVLGIKIKTGLQPRPAADASDAEWGYYELERKRHEARLAREEKEEKEWERKRLANEKASAAKTDDKEKRKRRRPCFECRRRHIKCDRAKQCGQCRKRKRYICEYPGE